MIEKVRVIHKKFNENKSIIYEKKELDFPVSLHFHDFYELELFLSGEGETCLNGNTFELKKGAVMLLSSKDFHDFKITSKATVINVQFNFNEINETLLPFTNEPIAYLEGDDYEKILDALLLIGKLNTKVNSQKICAEKILQGVLALITPYFKNVQKSEVRSSIIETAIAYIHAHFKENPSLETVAKSVYFDKRYFCSLFKKNVGKTYKQYLREVKLKHALNLLKCSTLPITKVAMESGYLSIPHFNREFYKYYNVTPTSVKNGKVTP